MTIGNPSVDPKELFARSKILVVGAGGIGCELLKNLVLENFIDVETVDLDTIELSNLNRQFLFRQRHIGKFKAEVAAEAVMKMHPKAEVVAHVGNIMDTNKFPLSFFEKFDIVLNALDNVNARRYVNNMCLALNKPLIESGTAGYLGQCTPIVPRKTECYDCTAKEAPKTFAVCTIRSTPSAPIHCVVWAKDYLLANLFGEQQSADEVDESIDSSDHLASLKKENEAFVHLRGLATARDENLGPAVFQKVFHDDIKAIRAISSLWESRTAPTSVSLDSLSVPQAAILSELDEQQVWSVEQWVALLFDSLRRLSLRSDEIISFDKDDQDTLDFVAAVANLRAHVYSIPMSSRFSLKALAGNIIPAIATTNAIAAGMIVIQAKNYLLGKTDKLADMFITFDASRKNYFVRCSPAPPNPECKTCFVHRAVLRCHPDHFTLGDLIEGAIAKFITSLGDSEVTTECLSVLEGSRLVYDEEDMPQAISKTLSELQAGDSKFIRFEFLEGLPLLVAIQKDDSYSAGEYGVTFDLIPMEQAKLGTKREHPASDDDDSSDLEIVDADDDGSSDLEIIEPEAVRTKSS